MKETVLGVYIFPNSPHTWGEGGKYQDVKNRGEKKKKKGGGERDEDMD